MKTYSAKVGQINRNWYLLDASNHPMGRIASRAAIILRGKHKKDYTPNYDMGDFMIITNAAKTIYSGKKTEQKQYLRHTNYPGGIKKEYLKDIIKRNPAEPLKRAIKGMIPDNCFKVNQIKRLKIYADENYKQTQKVIKMEI